MVLLDFELIKFEIIFNRILGMNKRYQKLVVVKEEKEC